MAHASRGEYYYNYLLLVQETVAHDAPVIGVAVVMEDVGGLADGPKFLG